MLDYFKNLNNAAIPALTIALIFIICPLLIASSSPAEIVNFSFGELTKVLTALFVFFFLVYLIVSFVFRKFTAFHAVGAGFLAFVFLNTFFTPVTVSGVMLEVEGQEVNKLNLFISLFLASGLAFTLYKKPKFLGLSLIHI